MPQLFFQAKPDKPFHLSIGAVVYDDEGKILCHYYKRLSEISNLYILLRETIENDEKLQDTVHRGLREEFGATGEIQKYLGSLAAEDEWFGEINQPTTVQKTTLYFLVKLKSIDPARRMQDHPEYSSEILHLSPDDLIEKINKQYEETKLNDINESIIIQRAKKFLDL